MFTTVAVLAVVACTMFLIYEVYKFKHFWNHRTSQVIAAMHDLNQQRQHFENARHEQQAPLQAYDDREPQDERFIPTTIFFAEPPEDGRRDDDGLADDGYDEDDNAQAGRFENDDQRHTYYEDDEAGEPTENLHDE